MLINHTSWAAARTQTSRTQTPGAVTGGIAMSAFGRGRALGMVGVQAKAAVDAPYAAKGAPSAWSPPV